EITRRFGYNLDRRLADIRPDYAFDVSCQGSVPEAIMALLEAGSWEEAVRNAVSLGGDADTQACMAGGIVEAYFGVPDTIREQAEARLPPNLLETTRAFERRFPA
ncbi:ADP-ribosylglycohydrolase family protein, partial [Thioalkalivibrio sp.]